MPVSLDRLAAHNVPRGNKAHAAVLLINMGFLFNTNRQYNKNIFGMINKYLEQMCAVYIVFRGNLGTVAGPACDKLWVSQVN